MAGHRPRRDPLVGNLDPKPERRWGRILISPFHDN